MLIRKTLKTMPWLKKGLFHSLKMHLLPLWVFLQTEMTDFPIPFHILYRGGRVLWNVGCVCVGGGIMFHSAISIPAPTQIFQNAIGIDRWYKQPCRPSCPYSAACASTS